MSEKIIFNDVAVDRSRLREFEQATGRSEKTEPVSSSCGTWGKQEWSPQKKENE